MPGNLGGLTDRQLADLFRKQGHEQAVWDALNEELKKRSSDEAVELHLEVAARRRLTLGRASSAPRPVKSGLVRDWLRGVLSQRGLLRPDGRPLYRYRLTDSEYEAARQVLSHLSRAGRLERPDQNAGVLFVAYCAEWFRRESQSTFLKWDEIDPSLFPKVPYQGKQKLTVAGLKYWRRELRVRSGARHFLLTLALEGGIPVRVVIEGANGWLREYLRAILRLASNRHASSPEELLDIARDERWRISRRYDHDDFVEVCAEFALAILKLRREAEAGSFAEIANSAILEAVHPGWQNELPIHVPAENEGLASQLLTGLIDEKLSGFVTSGIEARRYLVHSDGDWVPSIQLLADGEIAASRLPSLSIQGRARVIPAGRLAEHVSGEVALLEPPAEGTKNWRMRPLIRTARMIRGFPLDAPAAATLSSMNCAPVSWIWPGGEPKSSDVLIFEEEESPNGAERVLRFVRSGSASLPARTLYVLIRKDWLVERAEGAEIGSDELVAGLDRRLIEVRGTVYLRAPGETARYRVATASQGQTTSLALPHLLTSWHPAESNQEIVASPFAPRIREGQAERPPRPGELFWRTAAGRWSELTGTLSGEGPYDISLRDPHANIQIDRVQVLMLPAGARIEARMLAPLTGELRLIGMAGWSISAPQLQPTDDPETFKICFHGVPSYQLRATLHPASGLPFDVIVPVTGRDAVVALSDGTIVPAGATVDISTLRGAMIVAPSRSTLEVAPKGARSSGLRMVVDGEVPLGVVRSAMQEAFATLGAQDELLELTFLGDTRVPIRIARFREQMLAFEGGTVIWHGSSETSAARPVARMVLEPRHEYALTPMGAGRWGLPDRCKGPCLVYLRDGPDVVSRPRIIDSTSIPAPANALQAALILPDYEERQAAIGRELHAVATGGASAQANLTWLAETVVHLRGLPANTIDALRLLPDYPEAVISLLVNTTGADRAAIWALQDELPLLWLAMPATAWETAIQSYRLTLFNALASALPSETAQTMADGQTKRLREALIELEPALAIPCGNVEQRLAMFHSLPPLNTLTSHYVTSQHDRHLDVHNQLAARLAGLGLSVPKEIMSKAHDMFAGLFAPVLLAAAAAGKLSLSRDDILLIRQVLREDPMYVTSAWPHLLSFFRAFDK